LYEFWGDSITEMLNKDLEQCGSTILVNLASNEYFSSVQNKKLNADIITPVFKDEKNGEYKVISFWAKKARGMMARFMMNNKPKSIADLQKFNAAGYRFSSAESTATELVFLRSEADQ
ncbi:peroxide stress protein YaaA, partial [Pseudidiomarina aestuarii]